MSLRRRGSRSFHRADHPDNPPETLRRFLSVPCSARVRFAVRQLRGEHEPSGRQQVMPALARRRSGRTRSRRDLGHGPSRHKPRARQCGETSRGVQTHHTMGGQETRPSNPTRRRCAASIGRSAIKETWMSWTRSLPRTSWTTAVSRDSRTRAASQSGHSSARPTPGSPAFT